MKISRLLAASLLALLTVTGTVWAETVKVGVILPYSGPNAQLGQQVDRGFELYRKLHGNETGGHKIEIIKRDSTGPKPDVAKRLATELITRDKVDILAGVVYSNNAFAISDVTRKAKVPFLIMNAGTSAITTRSPYTARVSFTMWQAAYPFGQARLRQDEDPHRGRGLRQLLAGKGQQDRFHHGVYRRGRQGRG